MQFPQSPAAHASIALRNLRTHFIAHFNFDETLSVFLERPHRLRSAKEPADVDFPALGEGGRAVFGPFANDADERIACAHAVASGARLEVPREPKIVEDGSLGFQVAAVDFRYRHERDVGRVAFL